MRITPIYYTNYNYKPQFNSIHYKSNIDTVCFTGSKENSTKQIILILGAPNSGKGTCGRDLAEKLNIPYIGTGDILRNESKKQTPLGKKIREFFNGIEFFDTDNFIIDKLKERFAQCKNGFILDGFPRNMVQVEKFDELIKADNANLKIIYMDVCKPILYRRCAERYICKDCFTTFSLKESDPKVCKCGGKLIKRPDDTVDILRKRLKKFERETLPVIKHYGDKVKSIKIVGKGASPEQVLNKVLNKIDD